MLALIAVGPPLHSGCVGVLEFQPVLRLAAARIWPLGQLNAYRAARWLDLGTLASSAKSTHRGPGKLVLLRTPVTHFRGGFAPKRLLGLAMRMLGSESTAVQVVSSATEIGARLNNLGQAFSKAARIGLSKLHAL
jgi:hypothetical protein